MEMKMSYLQMYRNLCANSLDCEEKELEEKMSDLFTAALKAGDRRMAMELQDCIVSAAEVGAPVNVILRDYDLLVTYFPDVATQTLEILSELEA